LDDRGSIPGWEWEFFSLTPCAHRHWVPPSLLFSGYRKFFPHGEVAETRSWLVTSSSLRQRDNSIFCLHFISRRHEYMEGVGGQSISRPSWSKFCRISSL